MRKLFIVLGSVLGISVLALLIAPMFISTDLVKSQVTERVSGATGKRLSIDGDVSISVITGLKLNAEQVTLTEADGTPLLSIQEVDFGLALSPLLNGVVEISQIKLEQPRITLSSAPSGDGANTTQNSDPGGGASSNDDPLGGLSPETFRLKKFIIRNGQLVQRGADGSEATLVNDFALDLSLPALNEPALAKGRFSFKGKSHDIGLTVGNPYDLIRKAGSAVAVSLTSDTVRLTVNGQAMAAETLFKGDVNGALPSLAGLASWLSGSSPDLPVRALSFESQVEMAGPDIKILQLDGKADDLPFVAAARISTGGAKPIVRLAVDVPQLDLDALRQGGTTSSGSTTSENTQTTTGGETESPIDLSPLQAFDGFVDLRIADLKGMGQTVKDVVFITRVQDGALSAKLQQAKLSGGSAALDLSALQVNGVPVFSGSANLSGLDAAPLLALAGTGGFKVKGRLSAEASFQAAGSTTSALKDALELNAGLRMHDASVSGVGALLGNPKADTVSNLDVTASVTSLTSPVRLDGALTWNGERVSLDATADPRPLLDGKPTNAKLSLKSRPIWVRYNGRLHPAGQTLANGEVVVSADSLKRFLGWVGQQTGDSTPDGDLSLKTQLAASDKALSLEQISLTFGETKGSGKASVGLAGKPDIKAQFVFDALDVTPFLGSGESAGEHAQTGGQSSGGKRGWSTEPIDFSALNSLNLSLDVTTRVLKANKIKTGQSRLSVTIKDGFAEANLAELALYRGAGSGRVVLDTRSASPAIQAKFDLNGLNARPFLKDAANFDSVEGTGNIALDFATTGASEAQLVSALNGRAAFAFADGAIVGINIARMMRALTTDILTGWTNTQSEKTDFSEFAASFNFTNGIGRNDDLRLLGPLVRVSGSGTVSMPPRTIDYRVEPKLVANLTGQGGRVGLDGLPVPVIIRGSWDNPQIYPDIKGILTDPGNAFRQLQSLGGSVGSELFKGVEGAGKVGTVVKDVLGEGAGGIGEGLGQLLDAAGGRNKNQNTGQTNNQNNNQAGGNQNSGGAQPQQQDQRSLEEEAIKSLGNILFGN
ncbi:AsmA family protein [Coralliovum pocilloporae]|uniref:AsmA family protein n=1 Tax=Coralliovum pocilloporae TaxID=3066369 RepID=UPI00330799A8